MTILHSYIEDKYEILEIPQEGSTETAFKVRHRLLQEIRLVKTFNVRPSTITEVRDRFFREARLASQLRHPNIAQIHDFFISEDQRAFVVMEHTDGVTLADVLAGSGPLPIGLVLEIACQTLTTLSFLNQHDLFHPDVSPSNVMLTRDPVDGRPLCKLIDLGFTTPLKEDTSNPTSSGTRQGLLNDTAPAQLSVEAVDARSDLYAFGIILHGLLASGCLVGAGDPATLPTDHRFRLSKDFREISLPENLPQDLRDVVLRLLARLPSERFLNAEDAFSSLASIQARFPVRPGDLEEALVLSASSNMGNLGSGEAKSQNASASGALLPSEATCHPTDASQADTSARRATKLLEPATEGALRSRALLIAVVFIASGGAALGIRQWIKSPPPVSVTGDSAQQNHSSQISIPKAHQPTNPGIAAESPPALRAHSTNSGERPFADRKAPLLKPELLQSRQGQEPDELESIPQGAAPLPEDTSSEPSLLSPAPPATPTEDRRARLIGLPPLTYPKEGRGVGNYARIIITVRIDEEGRVTGTQIESAYFELAAVRRSSAAAERLRRLYKSAAVDAARGARFEPATAHGEAAPASMRLTIEFGRKLELD